jgi:hypothetical protein
MIKMRAIMTICATLVLTGCSRYGIDAVDEHGMTALMHAADQGNVQEAQSPGSSM